MLTVTSIDEYEQALNNFNEAKYQEAYIQLKSSLSKNMDHLPSKLLMGEALLASGYVIEAIEEYEESEQLGADPNIVVLGWQQGLLTSGQYQKVLDFAPDIHNLNTRPFVFLYQTSTYQLLDE